MVIRRALFALSLGLVLSACFGFQASAQTKSLAVVAPPICFFMECEDGKPNPNVAQPKPIEIASLPASSAAPPPPAVQNPRPSKPGESCIKLSTEGAQICSSSVLKSQRGFDYGPNNVLDAKLDTAWVEGVAGNGEGEWIQAEFGGPRRVIGIELLNGYHKNQNLFQRNNRVAVLEVLLSNGLSGDFLIADKGGQQTINFDETQVVKWVQLKIRSVYPGTKYRDTAISELRLIFAK